MPGLVLPNETIIEHLSSRQITGGEKPTVRLISRVYRTLNEATVLAILLNPNLGGTPLMAYGLPRKNWSIEHKGGGIWYCTTDYGGNSKSGGSPPKPSSSDPIPPEVSFDFGGQSEHVTMALQDVAGVTALADPNQPNAPAVNRAIGVDPETGDVKGTDIIVPTGSFTETWTVNANVITYSYLASLRDLIGRTNQYTFRSFSPGEVMFLGATSPGSLAYPGQLVQLPPGGFGAFGTLGSRKMVFSFKLSKNRTFTPAPGFPQITVGGFQYWWTTFKRVVKNSFGVLVATPAYVYVQDVGRPDESGNNTNERDFSLLLIGDFSPGFQQVGPNLLGLPAEGVQP